MPRLPARRARAVVAPLVASALALVASRAAAARVWVVDDGEKIKAGAALSPLATGEDNPVWSPGQPARLFALRNETVALQVVVTADDGPLEGVTVDLDALRGPSVLRNADGAQDPARFVGRSIERFVEHFTFVARASGGRTPGESLGWAAGSGPAPDAWLGWVPDALVPVEIAPAWSPYPLVIPRGRNGIVWIDVTTARDQAPGTYAGDILVRSAGGKPLASIPVELTVHDAVLPDRPVETMLFFDPEELTRKLGPGASRRQLWQLFHRHRIVPMHDARSAADVEACLPALDGSAYTAEAGYDGPGVGRGDGLLVLGSYGQLGEPDDAALAKVEAIAEALAKHGLAASTETFVYAIDERCDSPRGAAWKALLARSRREDVRRLAVGWTCSEPPETQPVDLPIVAASHYDPARARASAAAGKRVWIYNGFRPSTGSFLLDDEAVSPRVQGWLAKLFAIPRWFYWESTFWFDGNKGGKGPYDPWVTAEGFHNQHGDHCAGDGLLVYPGKQVDAFREHSIGFDGVLPSIRLKNLRRGIQDAGYLELARSASPAKADAIARELFPRALSEAAHGDPPSWPASGKPFFVARVTLLSTFVPGVAPPPAVPRRERARGSLPPPRHAHVIGLAIGLLTATFLAAAMRGSRRT